MTNLPQLRMRHPLASMPSARELGPNVRLRHADLADAVAVARMLNVCFDDSWNPDRVVVELLATPDVPITFVAEVDGSVVGSASFQLKKDPDPLAGWLHYIGVVPEARGLGLGEALSFQVLTETVSRGCSCAYLTTDDFRIPAIRTYLKLGFEPDCWHESHDQRWSAIREALASS